MSRDHRILILSADAPEYERLLQEQGFGPMVVAALTQPVDLDFDAQRANVVLGDPDCVAPVLECLSRLEWVQSTWAGVRPLLEAGYRQAYQLTGVKGVFGAAVSEYVFCFALMHERNLLGGQIPKLWNPAPAGRLRGKTMAILGVGSIGAWVAGTAKHFGMHTVGFTRLSRDCRDIDRYRDIGDLAAAVGSVDYLVSVLPDTPDTSRLLNREVFSAMKPTAMLMNVGRANVIDDEALIEALNLEMFAAAVLDVFRQEPLPNEHPFWLTPNLVVTSHTAAVTVPGDIVSIFVDNFDRFRRDAPLKHLIDRRRGY
ncbi:MAG: D-2-hydroxyacid dehydrogenase [Gammaproteobacteria bacterium]|nr:D-2-hydroxyacid dehydrogenase [Gammaproteobacteria bacterium]